MKIKIIEPIIETENTKNTIEDIEYIKKCLSINDYFEIEYIDYGPETIESVTDESFSIPGVLQKIIKAEKEGFDGIYINCFADPGLFQAKELVKIPVVGPLSSSILLSAIVGKKITVLSTSSNNKECEEYFIKQSGFNSLISNLRFSELTVLELLDHNKSLEKIFEACKEAVEKDNCDVIILGCTCMFTILDKLRKKLKENNINVQIIEPKMAALKILRILIEMEITGSFYGKIFTHINDLKWY